MKLFFSPLRSSGRTVVSPRAPLATAVFVAWLSSTGDAQDLSSRVKWNQPPGLAASTNIYYGWNQTSVLGGKLAADDWVCTTTNPVVKIRWWGSFENWSSPVPPPVPPSSFKIDFWTDTPKSAADPFSHPRQVVYEILATSFTVTCAGQDYDPRTGTFETCFLFEQDLNPQEWFYQEPAAGTNVYWVSIGADYPVGVPVDNPFGWKTRPRNLDSPDAAVIIAEPNNPSPGDIYTNGAPITWPTPNNEWDLAFELVTETTGEVYKWEQLPDLTQTGMDVNDSQTQAGVLFLLADDFLCTNEGLITNIVIWGSWFQDTLPVGVQGLADATNVTFLLSIHDDIPAVQSPTGYSMPGPLLWQGIAGPGKFTHKVYAAGIDEGWFDPPDGYLFPGDNVCHEYDIHLTVNDEPFYQVGSPDSPHVYWLDVQAVPLTAGADPAMFGWKSSSTHWNDAAVWTNAAEPAVGIWNQMLYPPGHPQEGKRVDLAFRIGSGVEILSAVKWSQPPVPIDNPGNWYDGWNEPSIYGGGGSDNELYTNILADDWLCTNPRPVSGVQWWGSFLNWSGTNLPPQPPVAYHLAFWSDVTTGPNEPFSHPGRVLWEYMIAADDPALGTMWAGWDIDPRDPCAAVESCFRFTYDLPKANWFQQPNETNVFWFSVAAMYPSFQVGTNAFGWKTRPHVPVPPDDAVRIHDPLAPTMGSAFISGDPLEDPAGTSWDMAFRLLSCQQLAVTNITITNITVTLPPGSQVVTMQWNAIPGVYYQFQQIDELTNAPAWTDVGPQILGPMNTFVVTNGLLAHRFYRLCVPDICP